MVNNGNVVNEQLHFRNGARQRYSYSWRLL